MINILFDPPNSRYNEDKYKMQIRLLHYPYMKAWTKSQTVLKTGIQQAYGSSRMYR